MLVGAVAHLQALGGLPEWEVYLALHATGPAREAFLRHLLGRNAPAWAADPAKRALLARWHVPTTWLADALAVWARYRGDTAGAEHIPVDLIHCMKWGNFSMTDGLAQDVQLLSWGNSSLDMSLRTQVGVCRGGGAAGCGRALAAGA